MAEKDTEKTKDCACGCGCGKKKGTCDIEKKQLSYEEFKNLPKEKQEEFIEDNRF